MDYCHQDAQLTLSLAIKCEQNRRLDWGQSVESLEPVPRCPTDGYPVRDASNIEFTRHELDGEPHTTLQVRRMGN